MSTDPHPIEVEDIGTWPTEITDRFEQNVKLFCSYECERERLLALKERDWHAHFRGGPNKYSESWRAVLDNITSLASDHSVIGHHSTRLCEDEISNILTRGMIPSSPEFLAERICQRVEASDIEAQIASELARNNQAFQEYRQSMIWFVTGPSILTDESGLHRLFRYWGGESLYAGYEDHAVMGKLLKSIGTPCIVVASLPIALFDGFREMGHILYPTFMRALCIKTESRVGAEGYMRTPIPPERILRVVRYGEAEFMQLTECASWNLSIA